ncbi:peptidylprolyl isomerase [Thiocapsa imhoffii]|uniref:Peptidyl-prolyl cis-trans isomerase n=1 Tax=Thiocapsa imhoffii TaxID=382777 RepID=A0A9X0WMV6_9GAMM|nr:FKBP-type peptidyl-prolyl cis-trans isomerase [Thiocapsa imhoffii]MBK1646762.1 peptidylprolyl isomerase [Thiocapsa imhoffii]
MRRTLAISVLALFVVFVLARSCALTPEQIEDRMLLADLNMEEGSLYLSENAQREGVVILDSSLQLEVLVSGTGLIPSVDDWVELHYVGWHLDGREVVGSRRRDEPVTIAVARTIPGWREALTMIPVGTRARLVVPPHLAYGHSGAGQVGPEETLIFELELLDIIQPPQVPVRDASQQPVPGLR